jgi:predicted phosphodiesterase
LAGNHERQVLSYTAVGGGASDGYAHSQLTAAELSWIGSLQPTANLSTDIFLCHGTPRSDCEHFLESPRGGLLGLASSADIVERLGGVRAQLIACGHSHVPRSVRLPSGQLIVNPGSVGLQAYTDDHPEPYRMELGTPDAHYAIVTTPCRMTASPWPSWPWHATALSGKARYSKATSRDDATLIANGSPTAGPQGSACGALCIRPVGPGAPTLTTAWRSCNGSQSWFHRSSRLHCFTGPSCWCRGSTSSSLDSSPQVVRAARPWQPCLA